MQTSGVCHTELHFLTELLDLGTAPMALGHEIMGMVQKVGGGVDPVLLHRRVLLDYYAPYGTCEWWMSGHEDLCGHLQTELGFITDGGFAPFTVASVKSVVPLPAALPDEIAASLGCSAATAVHATELAGVALNALTVIYGIGAVIAQVARHMGARVTLVGRSPAKRQWAESLRFRWIVDGKGLARVRLANSSCLWLIP
jgi:D-arabinose 1-dehydrogenase-like Zn-dependent alcohol dehydrogenase